jgi:hypothetical protein
MGLRSLETENERATVPFSALVTHSGKQTNKQKKKNMKMSVFLVLAQCILVTVYRRFRANWCPATNKKAIFILFAARTVNSAQYRTPLQVCFF